MNVSRVAIVGALANVRVNVRDDSGCSERRASTGQIAIRLSRSCRARPRDGAGNDAGASVAGGIAVSMATKRSRLVPA
jgi:hypothetical protein